MPQTLAYGRSIDSLEVVLVQDNRGSQAILRSMISSLRVRRLRAYDQGETALSQMMMDPPHVVVTDWDMKPMSGYRFIRTVRGKSMEPLCFVPIIAVMANPTMSMVERAFSVGANCVLVKPIAPVVLRRRLEWATRDERGFALDGDRYVVAGIQEVLESRLRQNELSELLRRQKAVQKALNGKPEGAPEEGERSVDGGRDTGSPDAAAPPETGPARTPDTWNSWAMR
jgi:two-component system, OmpR family, phosphate regulon response regulator PhoB